MHLLPRLACRLSGVLLVWLLHLGPTTHALRSDGPYQQRTWPAVSGEGKAQIPRGGNRRQVVVTGEAEATTEAANPTSETSLKQDTAKRKLGLLSGSLASAAVLTAKQSMDVEGAAVLIDGYGNGTTIIVAMLFLVALAGCSFVVATTLWPKSGDSKGMMVSYSASLEQADEARGSTRSSLAARRSGGEQLLRNAGTSSTLMTEQTISTAMSSPIGSGWLNSACSPANPLSLPTPLVVRYQEGEAFTVSGTVSPMRQESESVDIKKSTGNEVVARLHIAEDSKGSGILMELMSSDVRGQALPYPRVIPFAFLDTAFAARGKSEVRQVSVFGASQAGWDATALPSAVIKAVGNGRFAMLQNGQVILNVITDGKKLVRVESQESRLLAKVQSPGPPLTMHCASGTDAGLVLCAVVACMKLL